LQTWHPRSLDASADPNHRGLAMLGVPPKIVLHTTEVGGLYRYNPASYFGNPYWPHATIDAAGIHQHLPIDVGGYALYHGSGRAATNTANAVQCEIMAYAASIEDLDDDTLANVADWVTWVAGQTGAPLTGPPQGFHGPDEGIVLASEDSPIRFRDDEWLSYTGICGHQHVASGNDHWDPGRFPLERCLGSAGQEDDLTPEQDQLLRDIATGLAEWKEGRLPSPRLDAIEGRLAALEARGGGTVTIGTWDVNGSLRVSDAGGNTVG